MNEEKHFELVKTKSSMRRMLIYAALLVVAFLCGLVPMWLQSRECARNLSQMEHDLSLARMENALSSTAIEARRGDYEQARQTASTFFTSLHAETESGNAAALSQSQREGLQRTLSLRDEIITLLARSEPESADRLSDLYVSYHRIMTK